MLRKCNTCGFEAHEEHELELFELNKESKYGRCNRCKKCAFLKVKKSKVNNRERHLKEKRKNTIKFRYGITVEEYTRRMNTSLVCEICGDTNKLHYDHNHATGEFRGVLCNTCNTGIGLLKDNEEVVLAAYKYLKERGSYG